MAFTSTDRNLPRQQTGKTPQDRPRPKWLADAVSARRRRGKQCEESGPRSARVRLQDRRRDGVGEWIRPDGDLSTFEYLNLFDLTGIDPDASSQTATGGQIVWSFDPPEGDVFSVAFDAATEVGIHEIGPATGSVVVNGKPVVQVHFKTVVMP